MAYNLLPSSSFPKVDANYVSESSDADGVSMIINCTTPPVDEPGPVNISISLDGGITYTRREQGVVPLAFTYWDPPVILGISPGLGKEGGGTIIMIRGLRFSAASQYSCEFENHLPSLAHHDPIISQQFSSLASAIGADELMCISPTSLSPGIYKLSIKVDGLYKCTEENDSIYFTVHPRLFLTSFYPQSGSLNGGTNVSLQGSFELGNVHNRTTTPMLWCRFELGLVSTVVPSTWIPSSSDTATSVTCISPPAPPRNSSWQGREKDVVLSVSFNRQDWVSAEEPSLREFHYVPSPSSGLGLALGLFPTSGPWGGGTTVVFDINPDSPGGDVLCRFGDESAQAVYGYRLSVHQISCVSSPLMSKQQQPNNITAAESTSVMVWISLGDCEFQPTGLAYTYTEPITIHSAYPTTISGGDSASELNNSALAVFGKAFPDIPSLSCRLGGKGTTPSRALWVSSHVIKCPLLIAQGFKPGDSGLLLEVTGNGVDYFSSSSESNLLSVEPLNDVSVTRIYPTAGPSTGGWIVNLEGSGFGPGLHCLFEGGSLYGIEANVHSPYVAVCVSPPHVPGNATLSIRRFPSSRSITVGLHFFDLLEVVNLAPSHGPRGGGTHLCIDFSKFTLVPETLLLSISSSSSSSRPHENGGGLMCKFQGRDEEEVYHAIFVSATTISPTGSSCHLSCVVPPAATIPEDMSSSVAVGGTIASVSVGFMSSGVWGEIAPAALFSYDEEVVLTSVYPSSLFSVGSERVVITGEGFRATDSLSCLFGGSFISPGNLITTMQIECVAPPQHPWLMKVRVSLNGVDFYASYLFVEVLPSLYAFYAEPNVVYATGGSLVTLIGEGFNESPLLSVKIAGVVVSHAQWVSHSELTFRAPVLDSSILTITEPIEVSVSNDGVKFVNGTATIMYIKEPLIAEATPRRGTTVGGTTISLFGKDFDACKDFLECHFFSVEDDDVSGSTTIDFTDTYDGDVDDHPPSTPVVHVNDTYAMCVTPGGITRGRSRVVVALKGNQQQWHPHASSSYGNNSFMFVFEHPIEVDSVYPPAVIETGGDSIIVRGVNFPLMPLFCSFEGGHVPGVVVSAQRLSSSTITCIARGGIVPGPVKFAVSMNAIDWVMTPAGSLTCLKAITVSSLLPDKGPIQGGTSLKVIGSGFQVDNTTEVKLLCRFGSSVATTLISTSDTEATCPSPSLHDLLSSPLFVGIESVPTSVSFEVVLDDLIDARREEEDEGYYSVSALASEQNGGIERENGGIVFSYYHQPEITGLSPNFGSVEGGTTIKISVDRMDNADVESIVFVKFGGGESAVLTSAIVLDNRTIQTTTPCFITSTNINSSSVGEMEDDGRVISSYVQVQVSLNSVDFSKRDDVRFGIMQHPVIIDAKPKILNSLGGTAVNVIIRFFEKYGGGGGGIVACQFGLLPPTVGTFASLGHLTCVAPPHPPGPSKLKISIDGGQHWIGSEITVNFYSPVRVDYLGPHSGPIRGGTMVEIRSNGFSGTDEVVQCVFGSVAVNAVYMSSTISEVRRQICESPALDDIIHHIGSEEHSNNNDADEEEVAVEFQLQSSTNMLSYLLPEPVNYFTYYAGDERVENIIPGHGPVEGGTLLMIFGGKFKYNPLLSCRFTGAGESVVVPAEWQSLTLVTCVSPPGTVGVRYDVSVAANGADFSPSDVSFLYLWDGRGGKAMITPKSGPTKGGTSVVIMIEEAASSSSLRINNDNSTFHNVAFFNTDDLACRFGSLNPVPGRLVNGRAITCVSPPSLSSGPVSVVVTVNGVDYNSMSVAYEYNDTVLVNSLHPVLGPRTGGTLLHLYGLNFHNLDGISCRFSSSNIIENNDTTTTTTTEWWLTHQEQQKPVIVLAEFHSEEHVSCITPSIELFESEQQQQTGYLPFIAYSVSVSDTTGWSSPLLFYYYEDPIILEDALPSAGPLSGGTNVTVSFLDFHFETLDQFDGDYFTLNGMVRCVFNSHFSISNNNNSRL